ncbi:hypothetical protein [Sediminibacterium sp.]|uniref:hypothetical protein n=1 Tax=Sediminibacterium sp. TaxID=1917865 RepID=UPI002736C9E3|nr:hypothetical protein [Sediminibacterium sp.]MDP3394702.1 hypothetical protein [Sediminibacterium sp.]MDP3568537.1 hypothetical protein [Sediminibacterium sp.]
MKKKLWSILAILGFSTIMAHAQQWTPEEQLELFGYCEKGILMKELSISEETANKIGQINYWATLQKLKIEANTNDTFATANEVNQEVLKKYKALSITGDRAKGLISRMNATGCAITQLRFIKSYDTLTKAQLVTGYKAKFRKKLMDQLGVNGRQADMIIDAEAWKQKESLVVAQIAESDFNRIRKSVLLNKEYDKKLVVIDLTDQQKSQAVEYFIQNQL